MSEAAYLAIDPGDTTGWATFRVDGSAITYGQWTGKEAVYDNLVQMLHDEPIQLIILEDFRLYPWKSMEQAWSQLNTVRIIGAIECICTLRKLKYVLQSTSVKPLGYRYAGIQPPKNHKESHGPDAYVHGVYYLQKQGIRLPQQGKA